MKRTDAIPVYLAAKSTVLSSFKLGALQGVLRAASRRADEQEGEVELKGRGRQPGALCYPVPRKGPNTFETRPGKGQEKGGDKGKGKGKMTVKDGI